MVEISVFGWISIFAISSAVVNSLGIYFVSRNKNWSTRVKIYFMCFAAGLLISTPLMFALPNAIKMNPYSGVLALVGFLFMYFSNQIIEKRTGEKELAFGITAVEGIGMHSFIDGVIYTVTFSASLLVGFLSGVGLVVHEFAEGVITFSILMKTKLGKRKAAIYAFVVAALTTPVGAFIAYPFVSRLSESVLGLSLGFVSGVLIYVSAAHLLPEAREHEKEHSSLAFLLGVLLAVIVVMIEVLGG